MKNQQMRRNCFETEMIFVRQNHFIRYFMLPIVMMALNVGAAFAQQNFTLEGVVIDEQDQPVIGASIVIKGNETLGTISDIDGIFSLSVSNGSLLEISYIGYVTETLKVNNQKKVKIILREDTQVLNEVVVTGYGTTLKKNLTTAISQIKAEDVQKAGISNASQMLMGRAAGLQATVASAQPGGAVNISIRGAGAPIYVVDGIIQSADNNSDGSGTQGLPSSVNRAGLAGLNPEDIESIEVLKDASAAIYGIGAANGVILITTKSGKEGKLKLSYNGSISFVRNIDYMDMLDARSFMEYSNLLAKEQYMFNSGMGVYGTMPYDDGAPMNFSSSQIAEAQTTDWLDQVLRNGTINSHNVTLQGGSKQLNYYLSGNFYDQIGTVQNSGMTRYTVQSRVNSQVFDFLKLGANISFSKNKFNNGTTGGPSNNQGEHAVGSLGAALSYLPTIPLKDDEGNYSNFGQFPNPVGMGDITNRTLEKSTNLNFTADVDIIKNMLSAKLLYGYHSKTQNREVYIPSNVWYGSVYRSRGSLLTDNSQYVTMEATLTFTKNFADFVTVDAVAGVGKYINKSNGFMDDYESIHDLIGNDGISAAEGAHNPSSWRKEDEKRSQFVRASLDLLDRYVISGTLRRDGTDKFFPGKKYAYFPSVSIAWKIFNEGFMKNVEWVNMLKLRASYGTTGNDNLGTTLYGSYKPFGSKVVFADKYYIPYIAKGVDYPNVSWEKTTMKNIGLDFSILNDRISGSLDVFQNDITDMLNAKTVAEGALSIFGVYPSNYGHIRRYGWDASLQTKNVRTKDFAWTSTLTLSKYNAVWKEQDPAVYYNYPYRKRKDEPVNVKYFYRMDGVVNADKSNVPSSQASLGQRYQMPGMPIIKDLDGNGKIDENDIDMINVAPDLYWGLGNTFTYKNWDLDVFIYSQLGLQKYNYNYSWANASDVATLFRNQSTLIRDIWTQENPGGKIPGISYTNAPALPHNVGTDLGYENASFIRVRNITLGYNLSGKSLGEVGNYISNIRVYVDAQNPFLITSFGGIDPEVNTGGSYKGGGMEYPQVRTFSIGAKISF